VHTRDAVRARVHARVYARVVRNFRKTGGNSALGKLVARMQEEQVRERAHAFDQYRLGGGGRLQRGVQRATRERENMESAR